jgi:hypothetical protein
MKKIKLAKAIIQLNFLFWVIYNTYFGWNANPLTQIEENCDTIFSLMIKVAIVIYIIPFFSLYEKIIKHEDKRAI